MCVSVCDVCSELALRSKVPLLPEPLLLRKLLLLLLCIKARAVIV